MANDSLQKQRLIPLVHSGRISDLALLEHFWISGFFHSFSYLFVEIFSKHPLCARSWIHMVIIKVIIPALMEVIEGRMNR